MASATGPIVSPMSPAIKRSTRKRQRPSFFAEEITTSAPPSTGKKHSGQRTSTTSSSSTRHKQPSQSSATQSRVPARRARSEISELQDTVTGLRAQIESATVQMQELRSLVTMLADLYREESRSDDGQQLFSPAASSATEEDAHETDEIFSTTASEYDVFDDEQDEWLKTPLSPL